MCAHAHHFSDKMFRNNMLWWCQWCYITTNSGLKNKLNHPANTKWLKEMLFSHHNFFFEMFMNSTLPQSADISKDNGFTKDIKNLVIGDIKHFWCKHCKGAQWSWQQNPLAWSASWHLKLQVWHQACSITWQAWRGQIQGDCGCLLFGLANCFTKAMHSINTNFN